MAWTDIEDAIAAIARGEMVIVVDDENRENEGDIILAAAAATPEKIAFIVRHTSGVICAALPAERLDELDLPLMVAENTESMRTAFTITVDYLHDTSTGISASDRTATLRALVDRNAKAEDFTRPGHIFPIRAVAGGVLERPGHTEAAVDLTRLAGLAPGGVLCEIVNHDGSMARMADLEKFSREHGLPIITIADLAGNASKTRSVQHSWIYIQTATPTCAIAQKQYDAYSLYRRADAGFRCSMRRVTSRMLATTKA